MSIIREGSTPEQVAEEANPIIELISKDIIHKINSAVLANLGLDAPPLDIEVIKGRVVSDIVEEFLANTTAFEESYELIRATTIGAALKHLTKEKTVA